MKKFSAPIFAQRYPQGIFLTIAVNEINEELNKIVRYVNSAGSPAFSFAALEMRRFQKSKIEMLVPHVFGPAHTVTKPKSENHKWDEQSLLQAIQQKDSGSEDVARKIINWGKGHVTRVWYGEGATVGSFVPILNHKGRDHQLFALYTNGAVEIYFYWYQYKPPFESEEKRLEILERLNSLQGVSLPKDSIKRRPTIKLSLLAEHDNLDKFLSIYDWVIDEIKKS